MFKKGIPVLLLIIFFANHAKAQSLCTTLGQTPSTAFPVCGTDTFSQATVPPCGITTVTVPLCHDNGLYTDINPFWYRFTCYTSGTLAFQITPNNLADDYD